MLGIDAGHLGIGATADVCIFDPELEWTFDRNRMLSRGHNTPFHGWTFKGRATTTILGGRITHHIAAE